MSSINTTRDGIEVQVGQRWQCLETARRSGRTRILTIQKVECGRAWYAPNWSIRIDRMYEHSNGFKLLASAEGPQKP